MKENNDLREIMFDIMNCNCGTPTDKIIDQALSQIIDLMIKKLPKERKPVPEIEGSARFRHEVVSNNITAGWNSCLTQLKTMLNQMKEMR